jgi:dienelactone hydrolase
MRWLKQQIDRWAIKAAAKSLPCVAPREDQAAEVAELFSRAHLFSPPETAAALTLASDFSFEFPSSVLTPYRPNNIARGRIFPAARDWRRQPSVVLLHGWNAEMHYTKLLPKLCRALNRHGLNGVIMQLPYHLQRRPVRGETISNFISEDIPRMLEATRQAIADLNGLVRWLKSAGSPAVASWGFSLGGWLVGLHLCESAVQDAAVLMTPVSNLERAVAELEFCHPIRAALKVAPANLRTLNLQFRQPKIAAPNIHLVQAEYDLFVPAETYRDLAAAWRLPGWETVRESHITILTSKFASRRVIRWLDARL